MSIKINKIYLYALLLLFCGIVLSKYTKSEKWTLTIYNSPTPSKNTQQTFNNTFYSSKEKCREAGIQSTNSEQTFDCGLNCRFVVEYDQYICEKICLPSGPFQELACRD